MGAFNRKLARVFGYDIMRFKKSNSFDATLERLLSNYTFDCVIDVGANVGLFSSYCLEHLPSVSVISFEPASDLAAALKAKAATKTRWTVEQMALGDTAGEAVLHTSDKSVFNSLNAPKGGAAIDVKFTGQQVVTLATLDDYASAHGLATYENLLIKVDTQGHDFKVLRGGKQTLGRARAVIVELPFQNIYEGDDNYRDILDYMADAGFSLYAIAPISNDKTGAMIEADGFFIRR